MLHNRRGFLISSKHMLGQLRRAKKFASLLFFDLDGFKSINDTYGHLEGDRALVIFALLLKQTFRESDVVCRLGGDEFVALVDLSANNATMMLDRLREAVDTHNSSLGPHYKLKYSVGMSEFDPTNHDNLEKLLALADLQMLQKKRQNRASVPDSDNLERRQ
jgi:diguanylate cyclase (GGDEF)-like protein